MQRPASKSETRGTSGKRSSPWAGSATDTCDRQFDRRQAKRARVPQGGRPVESDRLGAATVWNHLLAGPRHAGSGRGDDSSGSVHARCPRTSCILVRLSPSGHTGSARMFVIVAVQLVICGCLVGHREPQQRAETVVREKSAVEAKNELVEVRGEMLGLRPWCVPLIHALRFEIRGATIGR